MEVLNSMATVVHKRLVALGYSTPNLQVIRSILRIVHTSSLITEEGRFVQGSITLANPQKPDYPPYIQRSDYPQFTALQTPEKLTPEFFVKIARAVDKWSGSIAIWGESQKTLVVWGIVDQLVATNMHLNRENIGGFSNPGILTVIIDRPGDLTAYHGHIFLASLRAQRLLLSEADVFSSEALIRRLSPTFSQRALAITSAINKTIPSDYDDQRALNALLSAWKATVARICIGLRRTGTGGTLLITPKPNQKLLSTSYGFQYERLGSAITLVALNIDGSVVLWDRIQLLNHDNFSEEVAKEAKGHKRRVGKRKKSKALGYSRMPKSLTDLLAGKLNKY